jgi:hypothetical protein
MRSAIFPECPLVGSCQRTLPLLGVSSSPAATSSAASTSIPRLTAQLDAELWRAVRDRLTTAWPFERIDDAARS